MTTTTDNTGTDGTATPAKIVYYEPKHPGTTMLRVRAAFESRGYQVTTEDTDAATAWVFVAPDGDRLGVDIGNTYADLDPLDRWSTPTAYVTGIVDWIERTSAGAGIKPGARVVYYEPKHNDETMRLLRSTLAERGYVLAHPRLWWLDVSDLDDGPECKVDVKLDRSLQILHDGTGAILDPVEAYLTIEAYALAIADWFDSDHTKAPAGPTAERAAWIAGVRAFCDLIEANPAIPLPHNDVLTFNVSEHHADRIATHMQDVKEEFRPGEPYDHLITGTLGGARVALRFGCARRGVQV